MGCGKLVSVGIGRGGVVLGGEAGFKRNGAAYSAFQRSPVHGPIDRHEDLVAKVKAPLAASGASVQRGWNHFSFWEPKL